MTTPRKTRQHRIISRAWDRYRESDERVEVIAAKLSPVGMEAVAFDAGYRACLRAQRRHVTQTTKKAGKRNV